MGYIIVKIKMLYFLQTKFYNKFFTRVYIMKNRKNKKYLSYSGINLYRIRKNKAENKSKKSFIIGPILVLLCIFLFFYLFPKDSSIYLKTNSTKLEVENFKGNISGETDMLFYKNGELYNVSNISIQINDKIYDLYANEFILKFINEQKNVYKGIGCKKMLINLDLSYYCRLISDKYYSNNPIFFKDLNGTKYDLGVGILPTKMSNMYNEIYFPIDSILRIYGDTEIYVKGKKLEEYVQNIKIMSPRFSSNDIFETKYSTFIIQTEETKIRLDEGDKLFIYGVCDEFSEEGVNGSSLKRTFRNVQSEYDISFLNLSGRKKDKPLKVVGNLDGKNNTITISGRVEEIEVAGHDLRLNIIDFIYDNLGTIILPIITAFILRFIQKRDD